MNFFEGQFRKMLWGNDMIRTPFYVDGACFGTLDRDRLDEFYQWTLYEKERGQTTE